jgi:hypothetical protein
MNDFGKFLAAKRAREQIGATSFEISCWAIRKLEMGKCKPTFQTLMAIARRFNMKTWKLIKEFEERKDE